MLVLSRIMTAKKGRKIENNASGLVNDLSVGDWSSIEEGIELENCYFSDDSTNGTECSIYIQTKLAKSKYFRIVAGKDDKFKFCCTWKASENDDDIDWERN